MTKEDILKAIVELPKVETNNPISTMNSINVDDLMNAVDRLNKIPDYNDLLKENQQKEFIKYLEDEKDRLARECSQIYEDSLGKTKLVNEDIFKEVNNILQKYKSIIGVLDDKTN